MKFLNNKIFSKDLDDLEMINGFGKVYVSFVVENNVGLTSNVFQRIQFDITAPIPGIINAL